VNSCRKNLEPLHPDKLHHERREHRNAKSILILLVRGKRGEK
jgi:hypothetical protein